MDTPSKPTSGLKLAMRSMLRIVIACYLLLCLLLFLFQGQLLFQPQKLLADDPERLRVESGSWNSSLCESLGFEWEDLSLTSADGTSLHAWWMSPGPAPQACVLICHGNAGNIADRLDLARAFLRMGYAVLLFDYHGYGRSQGRPTEVGLYADAECAYQYLMGQRGFSETKIGVFGRSLGGAVAIQLAARHANLGGLLVEASFSSMGDMAARTYAWLPVRYLLRHEFDSSARIEDVGCPKLIMHSPEDEVIPSYMGHQLFELAREPKRFLSTAGGHNAGGFLRTSGGLASVQDFLAHSLGVKASPH